MIINLLLIGCGIVILVGVLKIMGLLIINTMKAVLIIAAIITVVGIFCMTVSSFELPRPHENNAAVSVDLN